MLLENDILQVDAIVITGILILLTITSFVNRKYKESDDDIAKPRKAAFYLIIPFSVSAILLLLQNVVLGINLIVVSAIATIVGFAYLIVIVTSIAKLKE